MMTRPGSSGGLRRAGASSRAEGIALRRDHSRPRLWHWEAFRRAVDGEPDRVEEALSRGASALAEPFYESLGLITRAVVRANDAAAAPLGAFLAEVRPAVRTARSTVVGAELTSAYRAALAAILQVRPWWQRPLVLLVADFPRPPRRSWAARRVVAAAIRPVRGRANRSGWRTR